MVTFLGGGLLPIISLTSLHFFIKYEDPNKNKDVETNETTNIGEIVNDVNLKNTIKNKIDIETINELIKEYNNIQKTLTTTTTYKVNEPESLNNEFTDYKTEEVFRLTPTNNDEIITEENITTTTTKEIKIQETTTTTTKENEIEETTTTTTTEGKRILTYTKEQ